MQDNLKKRRGFTMVELLIVVAIIAILAAVAYPSYNESVLRGRRAEGRALLLDAAARLESVYSNTNAYATKNNTLPAGIATTSENNLYNLTVATADPWQQYRLTAAPTFADAACGGLNLTQDNTRGCAQQGCNPADCWGR